MGAIAFTLLTTWAKGRKLMRARMYDARRDEDEAGVLRFGKQLQLMGAASNGTGKGGQSAHSGAAEKV